MNKQQEPRLRFKGFTGEWEDKKLGELILYLKGFAFKTENYKDSGIRIIRGLDLSAHSIKNNTDSVIYCYFRIYKISRLGNTRK